ncbi:MAG: hypothetical protein ACXWXY_11115 [Aeromicrobium sp.]
MVFGYPIAGEPGAIGFLRKGDCRGDGIAGGLISSYWDKVKDGELQRRHVRVNAWHLLKLPAGQLEAVGRDDI